MSDPQTPNVACYIPTHASDPGSWDQPLNANFSVTDSLAANIATIGLTNTPVTLTTPPNSGAAWAGPYQSQSALIRFTGAITANITVTIPRAGFFIVENLCQVGAFYVQLASAAPGNVIGAPPGQKTHVFCDGVNMDFVDLTPVGTYLDLAYSGGNSGLPAWMTACTVAPYLVCNGGTFSPATYPQLYALLGNSNVLPDLRGRVRASFNQGTGRISASSVNGDTFLAAGGADTETVGLTNLPNVALPSSASTSVNGVGPINNSSPGLGGFTPGSRGNATLYQIVGISISTSVTLNGGGVALTTLPPVQVAGVTLIRAG